MIMGQNFKFLQSLWIVKLDLEINFVDVLEWNQSDPDDIWGCQIWSAAILDFFSKELAFDFGSKYQISLKFVYSQIERKNNICWCLRVKLRWFWRYVKMSNLISRHVGFFLKGLACDFGTKFQISSEFLYSQTGPRNYVCWCLGVKLKRF